MVLESLTTPQRAERKPWDLFFIGIIYAAVGLFLAIWVFKEEASIVMVLLTVVACVPLMYNTLRLEEEKDTTIESERTLLKEHSRALSFFMFLFVGFCIAFSLAYIFLPASIVESAFQTQTNTIRNINSQISGETINSGAISGGTIEGDAIGGALLFIQIFLNNFKVMLFCIFFSFFYGAGAIFILTWNASVISAAIGTFFRSHISDYASSLGLVKVAGYFHIYSLSLLRYFVHGLPEILAYFIGGLAGGIISVAVIRHDFGTQTFRKIVRDAFDLFLLAIVVLLIAAGIEVYITPLLF
ncbi:stage II sporulation protein M [Candidatus Woesearchaeota archaeon]|nr:stage II sporulation protein M [Candidatus Woesearchaeota archaeon]